MIEEPGMRKDATQTAPRGERGKEPRSRRARVLGLVARWVGWSVVVALVVLATASCLVRLMWYQSMTHPRGETQTDILVSKGSITIWQANFATNASQTVIRRSIFNRQFEPGFDPEIGAEFRGNATTLEIPFAAMVLGLLAGIGAELIRRRYFPSALHRGKCACGYSLAGLGARGMCPECGAAFGEESTPRA